MIIFAPDLFMMSEMTQPLAPIIMPTFSGSMSFSIETEDPPLLELSMIVIVNGDEYAC